MSADLWNYGDDLERRSDLEGFAVAALDGDVGKIDDATYEVNSSYIVIDTGPCPTATGVSDLKPPP